MTEGLKARFASLRVRTLLVVCLVVLAPVAFVWLVSPLEDAVGYQMRVDLLAAARTTADRVRIDAPREDLEDVAREHGVWIRVVGPDGEVLHDIERLPEPSLREALFFYPEDVPRVVDFDAERGAVSERPEVKRAAREGEARGCGYASGRALLVCHVARRVQLAGAMPPQIVYLVDGTPRAMGSLYEERFDVLKLAGLALFFALLIGGWLGWRLQKPLEDLRDRVLARVGPPVSTTPIETPRDDEYGELAGAFNQLLSSLEERRAANEAFMADMAHEIKNPVAAIRAAAESLERGEPIDEKRAARLGRILRDSSRRMDSVVNRFLALARAESGLPRAEREEVAIDEMVENLVDGYANDVRYQALEFDVSAASARVKGAAEHLETAIRNVLSNAASFAEARVHVAVKREDEEIVIVIGDDGPGIPADDLNRVFDRFFTRRDDGGGTGLGLAMAKAIAEAHGGEIVVESQVGEGTTFTIRLPALTSLAAAAASTREAH